MRRILLFAAVLGLLAGPLEAATGWNQSFTYRADLRTGLVPGAPERLAADYGFRYDVEKLTDKIGGHHMSGFLGTSGTRAVDQEFVDINSTAWFGGVSGHWFSPGELPIEGQARERYLDLQAKDAAGQISPGSAEDAELNAFYRRARGTAGYWSWDGHGMMQATQNLNEKQYAAGGGVSLMVPALHQILDKIPAVSRGPRSQYESEPVRLYLGGDFVTEMAESLLVPGSNGDTWRLVGQAKWGTRVFSDALYLSASFDSELLFDAPSGERFKHLAQVWVILPMKDRAGLMIKYIDGTTAPTYVRTTGGAVGINFYLL